MTEALEQLEATSEILRVIRRSPDDAQPVFDLIAERAMRLCGALHGGVFRFADGLVHVAATVYVSPQFHQAVQRTYPRPPGRATASARAIFTGATVHIPDLAKDPDYEFTDAAAAAGFRSALAVPMLRDGEAIGAIVVFRGKAAPFSERHVHLLQTFADQAVIAVENVRLLQEVRTHNRDLTESLEQQTATSEILRAISASPTDVQPVFEAIVRSATRLCDAEFSAVARFENGLLHLAAISNMSPAETAAYHSLFPRTPHRGFIIGRAFLEGRPVHVEDVLEDPEYDPRTLEVLQRAASYRSYLGVPIVRHGKVIGVIGCGRHQRKPFTAAQIELVKTFADQAVIAIENVRLFTELETRNHELTQSLEQQTATSDILRVISGSPTDVQPVFDAVAESAARLCESYDSAIWRRDGDRLLLVGHHGPIPIGVVGEFALPLVRGTAAGRAVVDVAAVHVADMPGEVGDFPASSSNAQRMGFRTILCVPLMREGAAIGCIQLRRTEARLFSQRQVALLETFADQAVIAIENARLFTELQARNAQLTDSLEQQTATAEILRAISASPTDLRPVLDTVVRAAARFCGAPDVAILRVDGDLLRGAASVGPFGDSLAAASGGIQALELPATTGSVSGRAVLRREVVHVHDLATEPEHELPVGRDLQRRFGHHTILAAPLLREGAALGAIVLFRTEMRPFSDRQVELLRIFADQAVIAIENVRLFTEVQERNRDLTESLQQQTATSDILRVISSSPTDIQPVFDTMARSAATLCEAYDASIFRVDGDRLVFVGHYGPIAQSHGDFSLPLVRGTVGGRSVLEGRPVQVADLQAEAHEFPDGVDNARRFGFHTILSVPLMREGTAIGGIQLRRTEVHLFTERHVALLQTFADQAVIAIENVRLFTEVQERNHALTESLAQQTATSDILRVISSSPTDVQPVFDIIAERAVRLCGAQVGVVSRFDGAALQLAAIHGTTTEGVTALRDVYPMPADADTITARTFRKRAVVHVEDVLTDPHYALKSEARTAGWRAGLAAPLMRDGQVIGIIFVGGATPGRFSDQRVELLKTFAEQAVIAIQNVRLFTEVQERNRALTEALDQQTATGEILKVISSSPTDVQPVFDTIVESAVRLCDGIFSAAIRLVGDQLHLVGQHNWSGQGLAMAQRLFPMPLSQDHVTAQAVREARTIHLQRIQEDAAAPASSRELAIAQGYQTLLVVPMLREAQAVGAIVVTRVDGPFSETQVALLQTFADQAVIAIENVRLFTEVQERNQALTESLEQQTATGDILKVISSSPTDVQPVFDTIVESAVRLCDGLFSALFRYDGELIHQVAQHNFTAEGLEEVRRLYPARPSRDHGSARAILERAIVHIPDVEADPEYRHRHLTRAVGLRSALYVPMMRDGEPIGVVMVARAEPGAFSNAHVTLLQTFADQAVIAIENVRLFTEVQERNHALTESLEQQTATGEILRAISGSPTDTQPVFEMITRNARRLCGADSCAVFTYDGQLIHLQSLDNVGFAAADALRQSYPAPVSQAHATGRAILQGRPVQIEDTEADPNYGMAALVGAGMRTILAVPMMRDGAAIGLIVLHTWTTPRPFSDAQIALLETFADQAVIAIQNVRLFTEVQERNHALTETLEQQTATSAILSVISSTPTDTRPVFETISRNARVLCGADSASLMIFDGGLIHVDAIDNDDPARAAALREAYPMPATRGHATGRAIMTGRPAHIPNVPADPEYTLQGLRGRAGLASVLSVPMVRDGSPIGAITVQRWGIPRPFSDKQIALLEMFAAQAVIAIQNVHLFKELEVRNQDLTETVEQQTATGEILRVISSSPTDVQPVFDTIAESAMRLCEGQSCQVFRYENDQVHFVASSGRSGVAVETARRAFPRPADPGSAAGRAILRAAVAHIPDVHADAEYDLGSVARAMDFRGIVAVPMMREGRAVGAIAVARVEPGPFSDRQIDLLRTFADQAVIAIENVRLFTELEARNTDLTTALEQQTATADVLRVMSASATDAQPVFDAIVRNAVSLCHARFALVYRLVDDVIHFVSQHNLPPAAVAQFQRTFPQRLSESGTLIARAILRGEVMNVPDILTDMNVAESVRELARSSGYRSVIAVPIIREGRALGALAITRSDPGEELHPFSDDEIPILQTFTDQAGIAIENVRLFHELETRTAQLTRSVGELQALGEVSQAVGSTLDLDAVLETIVGRAVELSGSDQGVIYEFDDAGQTFHQRATHGMSAEYVQAMETAPIRVGEGAIGRAAVTRQPVEVVDMQKDITLIAAQVREQLIRQDMGSLLALPLVREDRILGGLVIIRRQRGAFSPDVVAMLNTFAAQSVLAIHNARLFREIQRQKQYADTLVETSPVAIVTLDLAGVVTSWNPGAERLFGYSTAEALGRPMEDLVSTPEGHEEVQANIRQTLAGEWIRAMGRRARKDGSRVDLEISSVPVVVEGTRVGMIAIYHDITELLKAREEAETANEAKSAFLATMSHEIRTPMNAVIGMSGLLLNTRLSEEQRDYAEVIRQSGDTLLTVINDILDFSKIEAGRLELEAQPFDLRECVEGALDLVATRAAEKGVDLAYLGGDGVPPGVIGDVTRLRQVLLNLLSNAVKFTDRGEVVLSVAARSPARPGAPHELAFAVRDTGIGIPADRLDRLFQSFSQVDASTTRRYGGTGLGLAISQRLTEMMGGKIIVTSEAGVGSEFSFTIPAHASEVPVRVHRDLSGVQPTLRGKRVLVVDDNATNRRIVTVHLDTWGMPAWATESPLEALEWLKAGEQFDVAILDMHMPEMDGVSLARALRPLPAGATLPLILFTSLGRREARAEEEGFAAYLHKPIKPSQLFDALSSVLADQPIHVAARGTTAVELDPELAERHPLRILLAEDNVVNQKVALRLLAQMGYRADVAANGLEAIEAVARQTYDVVLMDVQMPELDGFEASREINRRWSRGRPRIVAMTANAMQGDRELCVAAGMDDYVAKPIRIEELVAALRRVPPHREVTARADAAPASPEPAASGDGAAATDGAIDRAVFDRLVASTGGPFVVELIDTFGEDARELLASLRRALADMDVDAFRRAAHSLKSTAESLGAIALGALARELEGQARVGSLEGAAQRLDRLEQHFARAAGALGDLRRDLSA